MKSKSVRQEHFLAIFKYEGWNFKWQLFIYNWYKIDTCFEALLSFNVVTNIVYNPLPAMWKP